MKDFTKVSVEVEFPSSDFWERETARSQYEALSFFESFGRACEEAQTLVGEWYVVTGGEVPYQKVRTVVLPKGVEAKDGGTYLLSLKECWASLALRAKARANRETENLHHYEVHAHKKEGGDLFDL